MPFESGMIAVTTIGGCGRWNGLSIAPWPRSGIQQRIAVRVEALGDLGIRAQPTWADAQDKAPLEQRIDHRDFRRRERRMAVGEVDRAAAELDAARVARERGDEDQARGDGLGEVGEVLADERFLEAEPLGEQHRLAVLFQRLAPVASDRVQRHGEVAELH
jgi:hypothetical protein